MERDVNSTCTWTISCLQTSPLLMWNTWVWALSERPSLAHLHRGMSTYLCLRFVSTWVCTRPAILWLWSLVSPLSCSTGKWRKNSASSDEMNGHWAAILSSACRLSATRAGHCRDAAYSHPLVSHSRWWHLRWSSLHMSIDSAMYLFEQSGQRMMKFSSPWCNLCKIEVYRVQDLEVSI